RESTRAREPGSPDARPSTCRPSSATTADRPIRFLRVPIVLQPGLFPRAARAIGSGGGGGGGGRPRGGGPPPPAPPARGAGVARAGAGRGGGGARGGRGGGRRGGPPPPPDGGPRPASRSVCS